MATVEIPRDEQAFLEYVQAGGQVEATDRLPDDYRAKLVKFIEMHGNSELMGVLPEREWILRAPTLQRKLALTAKVAQPMITPISTPAIKPIWMMSRAMASSEAYSSSEMRRAESMSQP